MTFQRTTARDDQEFMKRLFGSVTGNDVIGALSDLLGSDSSWVLEWVSENFEPEDVYGQTDLEEWAKKNGYVLEE